MMFCNVLWSNSSYTVGGEKKLDMETKECRMAIEHLLVYLDQPDSPSVELEAALRHIGGCSFCERHVGYLTRALTITEEDSLTCRECEELLPEYFQADTDGQASGVRWQPVTRHLATCPHCAEAYAAITDLTALAFGEKSADPLPRYTPNLSFLGEKKQPLPQWRLDELGRLFIQFSAEFIRAWQSPTYGAAGLKTAASLPGTVGPVMIKAHTDLETSMTIEPQRHDPNSCTLIVQVNIPSRGDWPNLADIEVTLKQGQYLLATRLTDAYGEVIFEGIATANLAQLTLEIAPD